MRASHLHSCRSSSMVSGHCDFHKLTVSCNPHRQKSHALRWAERGGQATRPRPFLQTHWMGKLLVNHSVTDLAKCGGASSCKYHLPTRSSRGTSTSSCSSNTLFKNSRYYAAVPTKRSFTYRPTYLWKTVVEIVRLDERVNVRTHGIARFEKRSIHNSRNLGT